MIALWIARPDRHLYICIHRCAKEKKGIGMLWLAVEEASLTMVV